MTKKPKSTAVKPGRPSKYAPDMGDRLIAIMRKGFSLTAAAGKLGVSRECIYEWGRRYPAFSDATKRAKAARVYTLEAELLAAPSGPVVTSRIFALKNADPHEWRDRHEYELGLKPDDPLAEFLRSINGRVLLPAEPAALPDNGKVIEGEAVETDSEPASDGLMPTDARVLTPEDHEPEDR